VNAYKVKLDVNLTFANSYSRLPVLLSIRPADTAPAPHWRQWFRELGIQWTTCDNISRYRHELLDLLLGNRRRWRLLMDKRECDSWFALPDDVEIFRGCGPDNRLGLSWSLKREVAERFPTLMRYRQEKPLLLRAVVNKGQIAAVKLDRNEAEVIAIVRAEDIREEVAL
jgi:hypothetical protein